MIFWARQLQEKSQEQQQPLMFIFWDLKKAFDKVPRPAMWAVLARFGCPEDFITLIRALHDRMVGRVCHQSILSEPFPITGGLKQGCVLAPTCSSLYVAAMLNEVPLSSPGINLRYRMDGGLFKLARFRAKSKTSTITAHELQFADDNATPAQTIDYLHTIAAVYNVSYKHFGMAVNTDKTKVINQTPPGQTSSRTNVGINGEHLGEVDYFPYLGSILSKTTTCAKDIENRIKAAHCAP